MEKENLEKLFHKRFPNVLQIIVLLSFKNNCLGAQFLKLYALVIIYATALGIWLIRQLLFLPQLSGRWLKYYNVGHTNDPCPFYSTIQD